MVRAGKHNYTIHTYIQYIHTYIISSWELSCCQLKTKVTPGSSPVQSTTTESILNIKYCQNVRVFHLQVDKYSCCCCFQYSHHRLTSAICKQTVINNIYFGLRNLSCSCPRCNIGIQMWQRGCGLHLVNSTELVRYWKIHLPFNIKIQIRHVQQLSSVKPD